jgi:hypothetical protein
MAGKNVANVPPEALGRLFKLWLVFQKQKKSQQRTEYQLLKKYFKNQIGLLPPPNTHSVKQLMSMKKKTKVQHFAWFKGLLFTILMLSGSTGFTSTPDFRPLSCIIEDLQRTGPSQGAVYYSWSAVSGASGYKVYYVRLSDGYTSPIYSTSATSIYFSGLSAGSYKCYFAPVCGSEPLEYITDELIII